MRYFMNFARVAVIFVVYLCPGAGGQPGNTVPEEKHAVENLLAAQVAAWNKADLDGFMTGYWRSEQLSFFAGGERLRGWQNTLDRYRKRYQSEGKSMGRLEFGDLEVAVTGKDTAWARGRWKVVQDKQTLGGLFTLILRKFPEGWRIIHDHTSAS